MTTPNEHELYNKRIKQPHSNNIHDDERIEEDYPPSIDIRASSISSFPCIPIAPPSSYVFCVICKKKYEFIEQREPHRITPNDYVVDPKFTSPRNNFTCGKECFIKFREILGISDRWYPAPGEDVKQFYLYKDGSNQS